MTLKKFEKAVVSTVRRTFVTDCPRCHLHFYGFHQYKVRVKMNNRNYRIVCHRCAMVYQESVK